MSNDLVDDLIKVILALFVAFLIYQVGRKLLGGSWEKEDLIIALLVLSLGWIIYLQRQVSEHIGEQKGYDKGIQNGKKKR